MGLRKRRATGERLRKGAEISSPTKRTAIHSSLLRVSPHLRHKLQRTDFFFRQKSEGPTWPRTSAKRDEARPRPVPAENIRPANLLRLATHTCAFQRRSGDFLGLWRR